MEKIEGTLGLQKGESPERERSIGGYDVYLEYNAARERHNHNINMPQAGVTGGMSNKRHSSLIDA